MGMESVHIMIMQNYTSRPAGFKTAKHTLSNAYHDPVTVLTDHVQYIHA